MELSKNTKRFFILLSTFTVGLVLCLIHFSSIVVWLEDVLVNFTPFIVGACLAFVLSVPMRLFERILSKKNKKGVALLPSKACRPVSLILAILLILVLLVSFMLIVVPQLTETISSLAGSIMRFVPTAQGWITELMTWLEQYPEIQSIISPYIPDVSKMASTLIAFVQKYAGTAVSAVISQASSIFSSATDVVVIFVFSIYVLLQKETLGRQFKKLIYAFLPQRFCDETVRVSRLTHKTFFSYVTIQCTEAAILGSLCLAGMLLFRFPHALVISTIMLFCALIPIYGAIISCIVGAFLVLIESPSQALWFIVYILVLQQVETNLIYPRIVSTSINLPSMWVLLAVTVGGGLFGIIGMITAVPIASVAYTLLAEAAFKRLRERKLSPNNLGPAKPDK